MTDARGRTQIALRDDSGTGHVLVSLVLPPGVKPTQHTLEHASWARDSGKPGSRWVDVTRGCHGYCDASRLAKQLDVSCATHTHPPDLRRVPGSPKLTFEVILDERSPTMRRCGALVRFESLAAATRERIELHCYVHGDDDDRAIELTLGVNPADRVQALAEFEASCASIREDPL